MELDEAARAVYRAMLARPGGTVPELAGDAGLTEAAVRRALDQLADLTLLTGDAASSALHPTPPRVALTRLAAAAEREIRLKQQELAAFRAAMESVAAEHESDLYRESLVRHRSRAEAQGRLAELATAARRECLSLNPGRAHDAGAMAASRPLNAQALDRGVSIRAIYQDSSRTDAPTMEYAHWLTGEGGEVRTSPWVPLLLVIVDGEVALLPWQLGDPGQGAIEVRVPALVTTLLEYFELLWRAADPLGDARHRDISVLGAMDQELVRLAGAGLTDEAVAHRLDVSTRTVRRMMADVLAELGAVSRFQAGVEAARRGWLD